MNQAVRPKMGKGTPLWSRRYRWLPETTSGKAGRAEEGGEGESPPHPSKPEIMRHRRRV